jgi:hypothetical protein
MTDRQNQLGSDHTTPRWRYETAAQRRVERKKRAYLAAIRRLRPSVLTGVLGMLEGDDYHRACERRGPGCSSGLPFYMTPRIELNRSAVKETG